MNIAPILPNTPQAPAKKERNAVSSLQPVARARNVVDEAARRPPAQRVIDEARRAQLVARADVIASPGNGHSARANRALASYAQVAEHRERVSLHSLLGFDDYA